MIGKNWQVIVYQKVPGLFSLCLQWVVVVLNSIALGEKVRLQVLPLFTPSLVHSTKCKALVFPTSHHQRRSAESRSAVTVLAVHR